MTLRFCDRVLKKLDPIMEKYSESMSKLSLRHPILRDAITYLISHYPKEAELSRSRLTKMVYLADWRCAITRGRPMTEAVWNYSQYGPFAIEAETLLRHDPNFVTTIVFSAASGEVDSIALRNSVEYLSLTFEDQAVLNFVIEATAPMPGNDFTRLVYSTFPLITQEKYQNLDLMTAANRYQRDVARAF